MPAPTKYDTLLITTNENLRPFLDYFEKKNIDWRKIAREYQIPEHSLERGHWLPTRNALSFLGKLFSLVSEPVGIQVGETVSTSDFPQLEEALENVQKLEQAIDIYIAISLSSISSHIHVWTEKINHRWMLCHSSQLPATMPGFNQIEWFRTLGLMNLCRPFLPADWYPKKLWMCTPSHLSSVRPEFLAEADICFGQSFGAFEVPLANDYAPMQNQSPSIKWFDKVNALVDTYATLPRFSVAWFAQLIALSPRTLQRRLKEQETSLSQLRNQARYRKAKRLLTITDLPIMDISTLCGYSDLSNFNRAFRSWSGMTAPQYRQLFVRK